MQGVGEGVDVLVGVFDDVILGVGVGVTNTGSQSFIEPSEYSLTKLPAI